MSSDSILTSKPSGEPVYSVSHQWDKNFGYYDMVTKPARFFPVLSETAFRCLGCDEAFGKGCELRFLGQRNIRYFKPNSIEPKANSDGTVEPGRFVAETKGACDALDSGAIIDFGPKKPTIEPQRAKILHIERDFDFGDGFSPEVA
jgi:hypothetical protein